MQETFLRHGIIVLRDGSTDCNPSVFLHLVNSNTGKFSTHL